MANDGKFRRLQCEQACDLKIQEALENLPTGGGVNVVKIDLTLISQQLGNLEYPFVLIGDTADFGDNMLLFVPMGNVGNGQIGSFQNPDSGDYVDVFYDSATFENGKLTFLSVYTSTQS